MLILVSSVTTTFFAQLKLCLYAKLSRKFQNYNSRHYLYITIAFKFFKF